jgi:hypothetical protein
MSYSCFPSSSNLRDVFALLVSRALAGTRLCHFCFWVKAFSEPEPMAPTLRVVRAKFAGSIRLANSIHFISRQLPLAESTCYEAAESNRMVQCHLISFEGPDPGEFVSRFKQLQKSPGAQSSLRSSAQKTAQDYAWHAVFRLGLFPWLGDEWLSQMGDEGTRVMQASSAIDRLGAPLAAVEQRVWCGVTANRVSLRLPGRDALEA